MKNPTPSTPPPALESQERLLQRLQDSFDAMNEVRGLTQQLGSFVVRSRIRARTAPKRTRSSSSSSSSTHENENHSGDSGNGSRKRQRVEQSQQDVGEVVEHEDDHDDGGESAARRMFFLYRQLQQTQALFQREIENFMEETEESCRQVSAPVLVSAE